MLKRLLGTLIVAGLMLMAAPRLLAQETKPAESIEKQEAAIKAVDPALVVVEYTLQYDKGEAPVGGDRRGGNLVETIREERPLEMAGVLVDATHVATTDIYLHPRFIKNIAVRKIGKDGGMVDAKISAFGQQRAGLILELSGALKGATPLKFDETLAGPYSVVSYAQANGSWGTSVAPLMPALSIFDGRKTIGGGTGVVVDKNGAAVAFAVDEDLPADNSWKGSPMKWASFSAEKMQKLLEGLDKAADQTIVRVTLNFRSPKASDRSAMMRMNASNDPNATVQQVLGVVLDAKTILILSELKPQVTARLERIRVFTAPPVDAKFTASLSDYGAFVAEPEKPLANFATLSKKKPGELLGDALPTIDVILQGEKRISYVQHSRIIGQTLGWQKNLYPDVLNSTRGGFTFDADNALLTLPLGRREKASVEERYNYGNGTMMNTSIGQLMAAVADLKKNGDPANVPLTEDEENRVAWIGVEMQALTQELARANNVSDLTNDGEIGGLVTFVYPDSPAGKAGVEAGWVLLRIEAAGQPKPIDVHVEMDGFYTKPFPWDRLDGVPEQYFDQIPTPWVPVENTLVRTLTDLGYGKKYTAEFFHDGKTVKKEFTVEQSPPNFLTGPKYKHAGLGLTVRDMTYEVRRYLQKKADDPGVVVSKIELGSKASLAGLKPYEQITAVNDKDVKNVQDFEKMLQGQDEVRLSVKRKTAGRIVKIKLTGAAATAPATTKPAAGDE